MSRDGCSLLAAGVVCLLWAIIVQGFRVLGRRKSAFAQWWAPLCLGLLILISIDLRSTCAEVTIVGKREGCIGLGPRCWACLFDLVTIGMGSSTCLVLVSNVGIRLRWISSELGYFLEAHTNALAITRLSLAHVRHAGARSLAT